MARCSCNVCILQFKLALVVANMYPLFCLPPGTLEYVSISEGLHDNLFPVLLLFERVIKEKKNK